MAQIAQRVEAQVTRNVRLDYLLYLPAGYENDPGQRWPLILFLHGSGERGSDIEQVKQHGIPANLEAGHDLPFIVVSPQCPTDSHWTLHVDALNALLDQVIAAHRVDESRVHLTGMSMGGSGTWMMAAAYPERFASVAPVCGRIVPLPLERLRTLPVWAFHGDADDAIPYTDTTRTVGALQAMRANARMTIYPGVGHNSWRQAYSDPELYEWFLNNRRP